MEEKSTTWAPLYLCVAEGCRLVDAARIGKEGCRRCVEADAGTVGEIGGFVEGPGAGCCGACLMSKMVSGVSNSAYV